MPTLQPFQFASKRQFTVRPYIFCECSLHPKVDPISQTPLTPQIIIFAKTNQPHSSSSLAYSLFFGKRFHVGPKFTAPPPPNNFLKFDIFIYQSIALDVWNTNIELIIGRRRKFRTLAPSCLQHFISVSSLTATKGGTAPKVGLHQRLNRSPPVPGRHCWLPCVHVGGVRCEAERAAAQRCAAPSCAARAVPCCAASPAPYWCRGAAAPRLGKTTPPCRGAGLAEAVQCVCECV